LNFGGGGDLVGGLGRFLVGWGRFLVGGLGWDFGELVGGMDFGELVEGDLVGARLYAPKEIQG